MWRGWSVKRVVKCKECVYTLLSAVVLVLLVFVVLVVIVVLVKSEVKKHLQVKYLRVLVVKLDEEFVSCGFIYFVKTVISLNNKERCRIWWACSRRISLLVCRRLSFFFVIVFLQKEILLKALSRLKKNGD